MRKIYFLAFVFLTSVLIVNAQYKLSSGANAFLSGDKHDFVFTNAANEGLAGENITWDFTGLQNNGKTLTSNMSIATASEKAALIPQANIYVEEAGVLFFFKVTDDGMEQCGTANNNNITRYDKPIAKLKFPFAYSNKVSGEYSGVNITQTGEQKISGTYEILADAYGTLLLPDNVTIKKALRVKQTRTFVNSDMKEVIYRWYAKGVRYPILVIIKYETSKQVIPSMTALYAHLVKTEQPVETISGNNKLLNISNIEIFPNPFRGQLSVKYKLEKSCIVKIDLIDGNGKVVKALMNQKQDKGIYTNPLSLEDHKNPGTYYIRIVVDGKTVTKQVVQQ